TEVLLTALARSLSRWVGSTPTLVELERHGREEIVEGVDLSRTVGWFTSAYPVFLRFEVQADLGQALKAIKEQIRKIPHRGVRFGLLRYLSPYDAIRAEMRSIPQPEVAFNYLGQLNLIGPGEALFGLAESFPGPLHSPRGLRSHLLEITSL